MAKLDRAPYTPKMSGAAKSKDAPGDVVVRAMTDDGGFRVVVLRSQHACQGVVSAQHAVGARAKLIAEMVTGTILVRETMSPDLRVQGILQGQDGKSRIVADSFPDGATRGLVQVAEGAEISLGDRSILQMMRTMHQGELRQGVVQADPVGGVAGAVMQYMQASEQVTSFIAVAAIANDEGVIDSAGGYVVQLLPEAGEGELMVMTERLREFEPLERILEKGELDPNRLIDDLLYLMPHTEVGRNEVRYECKCSAERLTASLATLPRRDIFDLVSEGTPLEIDCDYCGRHYRLSPENLRGLLAVS